MHCITSSETLNITNLVTSKMHFGDTPTTDVGTQIITLLTHTHHQNNSHTTTYTHHQGRWPPLVVRAPVSENQPSQQKLYKNACARQQLSNTAGRSLTGVSY